MIGKITRLCWLGGWLLCLFLVSCSDDGSGGDGGDSDTTGAGEVDTDSDTNTDTDTDTDTDTSRVCNGCYIEGFCYAEGDVSPQNSCLVCHVNTSADTFSYNDGASCDDGVFCTEDDACSGGVCAGSATDCGPNFSCDATLDRCVSHELGEWQDTDGHTLQMGAAFNESWNRVFTWNSSADGCDVQENDGVGNYQLDATTISFFPGADNSGCFPGEQCDILIADDGQQLTLTCPPAAEPDTDSDAETPVVYTLSKNAPIQFATLTRQLPFTFSIGVDTDCTVSDHQAELSYVFYAETADSDFDGDKFDGYSQTNSWIDDTMYMDELFWFSSMGIYEWSTWDWYYRDQSGRSDDAYPISSASGTLHHLRGVRDEQLQLLNVAMFDVDMEACSVAGLFEYDFVSDMAWQRFLGVSEQSHAFGDDSDNVEAVVAGAPASITSVELYVDMTVNVSTVADTETDSGDTLLADVVLISPSGTSITLVSIPLDKPVSFDNLIISDEAVTVMVDGGMYYSRMMQPVNPLSAVAGEDANGTWTLQIQTDEGVDGTVQDFSLAIR